MIIKHNCDLTKFNSYKIKSSCKRAFFPENESEIIEIFSTVKNPLLLGGGNNILLSKEHYDNDFLILNNNFNTIGFEEKIIFAEAGATTFQLSEFALSKSLSGFEMFYDIPSSIGGAIVMNAGAGGEEIRDILIKVKYLDLRDFKIKEIFKEESEFEYRNSFFQKNNDKIVLKAWFNFKKGNVDLIRKKMDTVKSERWAKQPRDLPNCGSVFKRPKGYYVGTMIEELGLKGFTIGGAQISKKHAGFIVNLGNATGSDIIEIIRIVKENVLKKFGVGLEVEQRII